MKWTRRRWRKPAIAGTPEARPVQLVLPLLRVQVQAQARVRSPTALRCWWWRRLCPPAADSLRQSSFKAMNQQTAAPRAIIVAVVVLAAAMSAGVALAAAALIAAAEANSLSLAASVKECLNTLELQGQSRRVRMRLPLQVASVHLQTLILMWMHQRFLRPHSGR